MRRLLTTLLFVVFVGPGPVIGLLPWLLAGGWRLPASGELWRGLGAALIVCGAVPLAESIWRFVREGRGTPAPYAPTQLLVVHGFYRWVRNPMYLGVLAMIFGQALLFGRWSILLYGLAVALGFHLRVVLHEEPALRGRYGEQFEKYCRRVRRWWPTPPH